MTKQEKKHIELLGCCVADFEIDLDKVADIAVHYQVLCDIADAAANILDRLRAADALEEFAEKVVDHISDDEDSLNCWIRMLGDKAAEYREAQQK